MLSHSLPAAASRAPTAVIHRQRVPRRQRAPLRPRCMMAGPLFLGLDVGTQSTKCLVYEADTQEVIGRASVAYSVVSTRPNQAEQHPGTWVEACKDSILDALADASGSSGQPVGPRVKALAVSGQQHGLVALDANQQVIRPAKLWCDTESAGEAAELSRLFDFTLVPSFTATKLLWLQRHEPQHWERLAHVLLPHDYINFWLTGRICMEASDASGTGLLHAATRAWDQQRIRHLDGSGRLAACLPPLIGPQEVVGTLRDELAAELGLPAGTQVAPGGGDNAMSALGAGAVSEGSWVLSLGTSGTLFGPSTKPVLDPSGAICPFCNAAGGWLPLLCTLNCAGVVEEVRHSFGLSQEEITAAAATEPPGCAGVTMLPYLAGERTPNWPHAAGAVLGLRPGLMRAGLMYRAAMEGATFTLLAGMQRLREHGVAAKELLVVGGGSRNKLWRRIVADTFQLPLRCPAEADAAALGAALQAAAVHAGVAVAEYIGRHPPPLEAEVLQPQHEAGEAYHRAFQRHQHWGSLLFGGGSCDV